MEIDKTGQINLVEIDKTDQINLVEIDKRDQINLVGRLFTLFLFQKKQL